MCCRELLVDSRGGLLGACDCRLLELRAHRCLALREGCLEGGPGVGLLLLERRPDAGDLCLDARVERGLDVCQRGRDARVEPATATGADRVLQLRDLHFEVADAQELAVHAEEVGA